MHYHLWQIIYRECQRRSFAKKREETRLQDLKDAKKNEEIRRLSGKDISEAKKKMEEKEMAKIIEQKKREKQQEREAKQRVRALIEADKKDRARKIEEAKLRKSGKFTSSPRVSSPKLPKNNVSGKTESRLQVCKMYLFPDPFS